MDPFPSQRWELSLQGEAKGKCTALPPGGSLPGRSHELHPDEGVQETAPVRAPAGGQTCQQADTQGSLPPPSRRRPPRRPFLQPVREEPFVRCLQL